MTRKGLPHSEIPGSKPVCGSPGLIAACHVLHRLCAPRHPPSTLSSLTIKYLRRVLICHSCLPDSFVKELDPVGSKVASIPRENSSSGPSRRSFVGSEGGWWSRSGSNRRPTACKAAALPTELRPRGRIDDAPSPRLRSAFSRARHGRATENGGPG